MADYTHLAQRKNSGLTFFLKGSALGMLVFLLVLVGILLAAEIIKVLPSSNLEVKFLKVTTVNPFDDEGWYALGRIAYYLGDYPRAEEAFGRTLTVNRLFYPAWIDLMWLSLRDSDQEREVINLIKAIDSLNPMDNRVHWEILLKAMTLDAGWARDVALGEIELLLPLERNRRMQLFRMASMLLGSDDALLTFVPGDRAVKTRLLPYFLYISKRPDLAMTLWDEICARGWKSNALFKTMIKGLFYNKSYEVSWKLWTNRFKNEYKENLVFNGGFERSFLSYGFSWHYQGKVKGVKRVRFVHFFKAEGRRSFSIEFDGEHNPNVMNPYQYIYLNPGDYVLKALLATKGVTGVSGFYVEVSGPRFRVTSEEVKGDTTWKKIEMPFTLKSPGLYRLSLRRNATKKLNRFLDGQVFFDGVRLVRLNE